MVTRYSGSFPAMIRATRLEIGPGSIDEVGMVMGNCMRLCQRVHSQAEWIVVYLDMKYFLGLIVIFFGSFALYGISPELESKDRVYIFSYLIQDEPELLSQEDLQSAVKGHRSNINALSEQGKLLIAGPLFEPKIGELYSGIFVFDVSNAKDGLELFQTDPAVQAKVFKHEMYVFECADPLFELPRLKKEEKAARLADPDIPDAWEGRAYVLALAHKDAEFERDDVVLIDAIMTPIDDEGAESSRMLFLDFETVDEVREHFKVEDLDAWSFYGWYGSKMVAEMRVE